VRRKVGLILIGAGAFFIALAPLVRFYIARQLVAAPLNVYAKTTLRADNATYLDTTKWKIQKGTTVTATNTTRGDVRAGDGKIAVWDSFTSIEDPANNAKIETQAQRAVFDRRTAELRNGRGSSVNSDSAVRQSGVGLFWPVGVKRKSYPYFDITTKRTWPMTYEGEEKVQGIKTYRFVQQIPATVTDSIKPGVPASLLGLTKAQLVQVPGYDKKNNAVAVDRVYQATTTVWVDPRTGAPVNQEQKVTQTLRTSDGVDRLVVADLDLKMVPGSQKDLVDTSDGEAAKVALVTTWLPYGGGGLGVILLIVGVALAVFGRRRPAGQGAATSGNTGGDASRDTGGNAEGSRPSGEKPSDREPSS
jgi:Porin PorA